MNGAVSMLHTVIRAQARIRTVVSPTGRWDYLWEPRPRGDYRDCFGDVVDMPQTSDRGEGAAPTTAPSPSRGEGGGDRGQATQPSLIRTKPAPALCFPPDGAAYYLWEPRPRGDYRDCFGDVVDMPQTSNRGEGAAPTTTPSPLKGRGEGADVPKGIAQ